MAEHSILFRADMVRAILDGRKTQTRRVVTPQPPNGVSIKMLFNYHDGHHNHAMTVGQGDDTQFFRCPYGVPGDRLWVQEAWCPVQMTNVDSTKAPGVLYLADNELGQGWEGPWRPSIHMPRWASRITLEVTDIGVQRVQQTPWQDIHAEGIDCPEHDFDGGFCCSECGALRKAFADLWDSINAPRGFGWDTNPWVWVVTFRRVSAVKGGE